MKINKQKLKRGWRVYNTVMTNFWLLITFCLVGFVIGYFVDKENPTDNHFWILIIMIIAFSIGIINFFFCLIHDILKLNKIETAEIKEMKEENPDIFKDYDKESKEELLEQERLKLIEDNQENEL